MARKPLPDPTVVLVCDKCGASGPANEVFYLVQSGPRKGALTQSHCRKCEYERVRKHEVEHRPRRKVGPRKPRPRNIRHVIVDGVECRPCTKCGETKPISEFTVRKGNGVLIPQCKPCRSAHENGQYHAGNRKKETPEQRRERYLQADKEVKRMAVRRRRARLREAGPMISTEEWLAICEQEGHRCFYCDVHAPGHLTMDHVIPVSRGGDSSPDNLVPACGPRHNNCNARKAALTGVEYLRSTRHPFAGKVA